MIYEVFFFIAALVGIGMAANWYGERETRRIWRQWILDSKLNKTIEQAWDALEEGRRVIYGDIIDQPSKPIDPPTTQ